MCVHTVYITSSPDSPPHIHTYVIPAPVTAKHLLPPRPRPLLEARPCPRCGPGVFMVGFMVCLRWTWVWGHTGLEIVCLLVCLF